MRFSQLSTLVALSALLLSLPVFADSFSVFNNPGAGNYIPSTTDYGGGNGSGTAISSLGPFNFSTPVLQFAVGHSWSSWNCPPFTESCRPKVLYAEGASTLTLSLTAHGNTAGFEFEPDEFLLESISATFVNNLGQDIATITRYVNGKAVALLFALRDNTPGRWIDHINIVDSDGDDFAIAQLRQGNSVIPEPGTILMFGSGLLAALRVTVMRRKMSLGLPPRQLRGRVQ